MKQTMKNLAMFIAGVIIGGSIIMSTTDNNADHLQGVVDCLIDIERYAVEKRQDIDLTKSKEVE